MKKFTLPLGSLMLIMASNLSASELSPPSLQAWTFDHDYRSHLYVGPCKKAISQALEAYAREHNPDDYPKFLSSQEAQDNIRIFDRLFSTTGIDTNFPGRVFNASYFTDDGDDANLFYVTFDESRCTTNPVVGIRIVYQGTDEED